MEKSFTKLSQKLLREQKENIAYYFEHISFSEIEAMLEKLALCKGAIYFTGIGKSGIIAKKIVATMISTGTRSHFIAPIDALHGDIGSLSEDDILVLLSKSGESDELLRLIPFVRNRGAFTISLVSKKNNRLAAATDMLVCLPMQKELCPFDLAPTTSAELQLLFGDFLTIALMEAKGVTLQKYAENHPAGHIGKRVTLTVKELMLKEEKVPLAGPDDCLADVLSEFSDKRCGCLLVVDEDKKLLGIFTDGDLRRSLQRQGTAVLNERMRQLMQKNPKSIDLDALAWEAMRVMESDQKHPVMVLPVLEANKWLKGIIKMHDILQSGL